MANDQPADGDDNLLDLYHADSSTIADYYNRWADDYNDDLRAWGYEAFRVAVDLLGDIDRAAPVLDAGCGTGLVAGELAGRGFTDVTGIDISADSLTRAQASGHYTATALGNLNEPPLPFAENAFAAAVCVGVLSYVSDLEAAGREFARLVGPGGRIVLTQRSDLFVERETEAVWRALADEGVWSVVEITGRRPYMPGNAEYADVDVHYGVFDVLTP